MEGIEIVTKKDLTELEERLISEIRKANGAGDEPKKLLKSYQVKHLLKISPGTCQNLRVNGTLPFTRVGGIIYYKYEDIMKIFEQAKERTKTESYLLFKLDTPTFSTHQFIVPLKQLAAVRLKTVKGSAPPKKDNCAVHIPLTV